MIVGVPEGSQGRTSTGWPSPRPGCASSPPPATPCWSRRGPASARPSPTTTSSPPGRRSWTTPTTIWADADLVLGVKEPVAEEYPRLGLRPGPGALHLPPPGRVAAVHRRPGGRGQHGHRLRDGAPARQLTPPAHPDERGGRPDGAADGVPPPDAARRWPGHPGLRGARGRCAKMVILGAGVAGMAAATLAVGHARRGLHPRPQPRAAAPGRPPLPRGRWRRWPRAPTPSRSLCSTPTS